MRKLLVVLLVSGLVAGAMAPATAQKRKKKPKPVPVELFLHGEEPYGEMGFLDRYLGDTFHDMSVEEPEGTSSKSQFITNYVVGPNSRCDGNGLLGTVWRGDLAGKVKGEATLILHTTATPGAVIRVGLYPDGTGTCAAADDPDPESAGLVDVDVAPGENETEVVFEDLDFTAVSSLVLQISGVRAASSPTGHGAQYPGQVRIYFDSETHPSSIAFRCTPAKGRTC